MEQNESRSRARLPEAAVARGRPNSTKEARERVTNIGSGGSGFALNGFDAAVFMSAVNLRSMECRHLMHGAWHRVTSVLLLRRVCVWRDQARFTHDCHVCLCLAILMLRFSGGGGGGGCCTVTRYRTSNLDTR